jgi:hypothetical protein
MDAENGITKTGGDEQKFHRGTNKHSRQTNLKLRP